VTVNERIRALLRAEVHIWHGRVPGDGGTCAAYPSSGSAVLSRPERDRLARLVSPVARARFAAAHTAVRYVLGGYLDVDPAEIQLGRRPCCRCGSNAHGRPAVVWPATVLNHNVSHSSGHWLLAVALGGPVGVDIERHRDADIGRLAAACLSGTESSFLARQPRAARPPVFFRCWTRKEAILKACGVGIIARLPGVEVQPHIRPAALVDHTSGSCPRTWLVRDLPVADGLSAAIAQPARTACPIRSYEFFRPGE
jgi:4'-phosphopantetheinyl transferase